MTGSKYFAVDYAALLLGPGVPIRVCSARILVALGIWASRRNLPAVSKLQHISYHRLTSGGKVINAVAIVVPTQATDLTLKIWAELDEYAGFLIPHENQPSVSVNHHVDAHVTDLVWHFPSTDLLYHFKLSITEYQFIVP